MAKIDIKTLRFVTNAIFDFMEKELDIENISFEDNEYWSVPDTFLYDLAAEPSALDCGSLADDIHFVDAAFRDESQALPATLAHLAPILHKISKIVQNYKMVPD